MYKSIQNIPYSNMTYCVGMDAVLSLLVVQQRWGSGTTSGPSGRHWRYRRCGQGVGGPINQGVGGVQRRMLRGAKLVDAGGRSAPDHAHA
jgi:hypothetical protein